ncbi:MAG: Na(+)/H(+) antiporter subunit D [Planctomycetes bacterium]|nr:Na(+)/H(+) antiporter subunit D [Planctomycetota bacterium]MCB9918516.1 Na(+)/H(+) antiporter subunit D [Planctomycetota bacterium]
MFESLPPGLLLIVGGLLALVLRGTLRSAVLLALPILGAVQLWWLPNGYTINWQPFEGYLFEIVRVDELSRVFGYVFYLAAFLSVLFSLHVKDTMQQCAGIAYAGSGVAALFAGDLITLFVWWELTAVTSVFLIFARRTDRAYRTGVRYLVVQVLSGVLLLAGALLHYGDTGSLAFGKLGLGSLGRDLIFVAFGIKAAFPLLNGWLQDAYPESTATGSVWLSSFTTKLAIYALARGYAGTEILIPIGCVMTVFPVFFAVIENDLRRVLAYSLNNQLGFMVVGIGIGTELALNGTAAHAFAHILYKSLLFMSMGAVLYRTGTVKASELGGLYKSMPWTATFCIIGAAAISAFPLFSGFTSKSMILTAAAEEHHPIVFLVLLFASAGVLEHSGIKIPYFAFFAHDSGKRVQEAPRNMLVAMGIAAALCIGLGVFYQPLYALLPHRVPYSPYTMSHIVTQLQLLVFAIAAFVILQKLHLYPSERRATILGADWFYRRPFPALAMWSGRMISAAQKGFVVATLATLRGGGRVLRKLYAPPGPLGEPWPTGPAALVAAILLVVYLVSVYV